MTILWQTIDEWYPEEFDNIDGVQKYLKYCKDNGITKEYLDNKIGLNTKDVMQYYENLEIGDTMEYLEYIAEVDELNPENNKEHIVNFYENKQDYIDGERIESVSLKMENLKQNIRDYIEENYNLEEKDMRDERAYFTFVLGYDVLQDMFRNSTAPECDLVYDFCDYEAGRFLESKEYRNPKHSGYEMLVEWVDKNKGQILEDFKEMTGGEIEIYNGNMRIIEKGYRNKEPVALVEKTIGNEKEYIVAFFYGDGANPVILKSEFILSLCEQLIGGNNLGPKQKSIIDRCTASVYRHFQQGNYQGTPPTLQDFREELLKQSEPEAKEIALAIELFTNGSLNTFAKETNVDTDNRLICYDILDLGKQLQPIGMLVVLDSILNRITRNRAKGRNTFIFIDEIYLLFQHEYSANFLFTLWKRVRKYGAFATGITQNVDDLLQSHTARTMLANSEFIVMLNQASTDRVELAKLLNISDLQMNYITNVGAGQGLIKISSILVPFINRFPKNTKLYKLMTTKPGEGM